MCRPLRTRTWVNSIHRIGKDRRMADGGYGSSAGCVQWAIDGAVRRHHPRSITRLRTHARADNNPFCVRRCHGSIAAHAFANSQRQRRSGGQDRNSVRRCSPSPRDRGLGLETARIRNFAVLVLVLKDRSQLLACVRRKIIIHSFSQVNI